MEVREAEWLFAAQPRAVPQALGLIANTLHHLPDESLEVILLLADEAMTNAFLHGTAAVGLHLGWDGEGVRVEVTDPSCREPAMQSLDREALNGREKPLEDGLSVDWGVLPPGTGKGKTVWFTLHT